MNLFRPLSFFLLCLLAGLLAGCGCGKPILCQECRGGEPRALEDYELDEYFCEECGAGMTWYDAKDSQR